MKFKILTALSVLAAIAGYGDAHATATTTPSAGTDREGRVYNHDTQQDAIRDQAQTGDTIVNGGKRYTYVAPADSGKVFPSGQFIIGGTFSTYVYNSTYTERNRQNETRQVAVAMARAEGQILGDRISERINAAMHHESPNALGVFAVGNGSGDKDSQKGMNAGGRGSNLGIWAQYGFTHIRDTGTASEFKGNLHSGTVGVDYLFTPCFLAGLAFTYGRMSDGKYGGKKEGKYDHHSHTYALYAALIAHQYVSFDAMLAYGRTCEKFTEKQSTVDALGGLVVDTAGPDLEGNTNSRRFFGSIFANARYAYEMLNLWLRAGYSHTHNKQEAFNMSDSTNVHATERRDGGSVNIGNLKARLRVGYRVHEMIEPYVQGDVNYDVVRTKINANLGASPKEKRFGWMVGGGFRLFNFLESTTGGVNYTFNKRGDLKIHNVTVDIRHDF